MDKLEVILTWIALLMLAVLALRQHETTENIKAAMEVQRSINLDLATEIGRCHDERSISPTGSQTRVLQTTPR